VAAVRRGADFMRRIPLGTHTFSGVQRTDDVVAGWLGAAEAAALRALGGPREAALRLARQGDLAAAREPMAYARGAPARPALSARPAARAVAAPRGRGVPALPRRPAPRGAARGRRGAGVHQRRQ